MENNQIEGFLGDLTDRVGSITAIVYVNKEPPKPKDIDSLSIEEQRKYYKSPEYLKAKAEIEKRVESLHLGKVMLTQDQ